MASAITLVGGSPLIGSPITYQVTAATVENACSFHRVKLTIQATLSNNLATSRKITLSSPAESGETLTFDISSALRAIADRYQYTPTPPGKYPHIVYNLSACDEYMQNGEIHDNVGTVSISGGIAIMGAYSDFERLLSDGSKAAQHFTRKPKTLPEIVMVGETMVCPQSFYTPVSLGSISTGPSSVETTIETEGLQTVNGRFVYALPSGQPDRYQFRFVNSLGCLESISLSTLRTTEINCTSETYIRAVQETFGSFSRSLVSKKNDYEVWKMGTPPLDEAWLSWFVHEFMMSRYVWINIENHWIPCHIIPEETTQGLNRVENSLITASFSVRLDINGSPLNALAI